nr:bifunctional riboflavin kinase/FAD synthetase [Tissierella sp.]
MEIIKIENYIEKRFNTSIALGNFDGIHLGHKKLISSMVEEANFLSIIPSVLLFSKHPKEVLMGKSPELLTSLIDKHEILRELGVKIVYETEFTPEFMTLSPEQFVKEILLDKLNIKSVFVGFDYRFGHKASGDVGVLKALGQKYDFKVTVIDAVYDEKNVLSSTKIRDEIRDGNIELANEMLDRNYKIRGKVVHGNKIGRTLGFPTANIELLSNYPVPKIGVYETKAIVAQNAYKSLTSIGTNPTVGGDRVKIETYILDFDEDIYGEDMEIEFIEYLRDEWMFDSLEELKIQMQKDVDRVKY